MGRVRGQGEAHPIARRVQRGSGVELGEPGHRPPQRRLGIRRAQADHLEERDRVEVHPGRLVLTTRTSNTSNPFFRFKSTYRTIRLLSTAPTKRSASSSD